MSSETPELEAFDLPYQPPIPDAYDPNIALIGCGQITKTHLEGYQKSGFDVVVFCDIDEETARQRRDNFCPDADVYVDADDVLDRDDVDIIDIATRASVRAELIEDALNAGKHVLSQKPFVLNLDTGQRLVDTAEENGVKLAVNQNGRWAPHWSYLRHAVAQGLIGDPITMHLAVHWNHDWIANTPFDEIDHAVLGDFAIHWYDILATVLSDREPETVYSTITHSPVQSATSPLLGQTIVAYDESQASLVFDGNTRNGTRNRTSVGGTEGSIHSEGPNDDNQTVSLEKENISVSPTLEGTWFPDGFRGTMGELLCAIEEDREPSNSGRNNLRSLELCFAAIASAEDGEPKVPGEVRYLPSA